MKYLLGIIGFIIGFIAALFCIKYFKPDWFVAIGTLAVAASSVLFGVFGNWERWQRDKVIKYDLENKAFKFLSEIPNKMYRSFFNSDTEEENKLNKINEFMVCFDNEVLKVAKTNFGRIGANPLYNKYEKFTKLAEGYFDILYNKQKELLKENNELIQIYKKINRELEKYRSYINNITWRIQMKEFWSFGSRIIWEKSIYSVELNTEEKMYFIYCDYGLNNEEIVKLFKDKVKTEQSPDDISKIDMFEKMKITDLVERNESHIRFKINLIEFELEVNNPISFKELGLPRNFVSL